MSRPTLTAAPSGANFTIDVPPQWYAIVTAVSPNAAPVAALS